MTFRMHDALRTDPVWRRAGVGLVAMACLCGCAHQSSLAEVAHDIPPFESLATVHLGMSADAFAHARPTARVAEYSGYRDSAGVFDVEFRFSRPPLVRNALPNGSLDVVRAARDFTADSLTQPVWNSMYARITYAFRRRPDGCFTVPGEFGGGGLVTIWDEPAAELIAGRWSMPAEAAARLHRSPSGIVLILQTRAQAEHLASIQPRRRVACPR